MTNAEIKELAIKHGLCQPSGDQFTAIDVKQLSFVKELEAITREKMLDEIKLLATCECGDGFTIYDRGVCVNCLASMPPVPEGMQLVPIEPTEAMIEACFDLIRCEWTNPKKHYVSHYKAMVAAAKKG